MEKNLRQVNWRAYSFSVATNMIFNCNAIKFVNAGDKSTVTINDSYTLIDATATTLSSLNAIELNSDRDELDTTSYKISFTPTNAVFAHKLLVWVKTYEDVPTKNNIRLDEIQLPDRKEELKQLQAERERKM